MRGTPSNGFSGVPTRRYISLAAWLRRIYSALIRAAWKSRGYARSFSEITCKSVVLFLLYTYNVFFVCIFVCESRGVHFTHHCLFYLSLYLSSCMCIYICIRVSVLLSVWRVTARAILRWSLGLWFYTDIWLGILLFSVFFVSMEVVWRLKIQHAFLVMTCRLEWVFFFFF